MGRKGRSHVRVSVIFSRKFLIIFTLELSWQTAWDLDFELQSKNLHVCLCM